MTTPLWLSRSLISFLYSSSVYSFHIFLIFSASTKSPPFLSFYCAHLWAQYFQFSWRDPWCIPFCCFPLFLSIVHWRRPSCLSLLFFGTLHLVGYIFPFLPCFSLLSSTICKDSSDNHLPSCLFFFHFVKIEHFKNNSGIYKVLSKTLRKDNKRT